MGSQKDQNITSAASYAGDKLEDTLRPQRRSPWLNESTVFQMLIALRILNALTIRTFFQPDEYYQGLEPAWYSAFGPQGGAWITWEWREHLRSSLHPALFALTYRSARFISAGLDLRPTSQAELLLAAPKILQALIAATGDLYTWKLSKKVYSQDTRAAITTLVLTIVSPWQWFCSTRTFSNGLEAALTVVALDYWPFPAGSIAQSQASQNVLQSRVKNENGDETVQTGRFPGLRIALMLAAFATVLRPTNIIIWAALSLYTFLPTQILSSESPSRGDVPTVRHASNTKTSLSWLTLADLLDYSKNVLLCGTTVLALSAFSDQSFYQQYTFPPLNFLFFNVVMSLAIFYGNNNWHYYLSEGYPLLLTTALPFALFGIYQAIAQTDKFSRYSTSSQNILRGLLLICMVLPASLSLLSHKEVRFIHPLLPALHIFAAAPASTFFSSVFIQEKPSRPSKRSGTAGRRVLLIVLLTMNVVISYYTSQVHNSGIISITHYFRTEFENHYLVTDVSEQQVLDRRSMTVALFMPCHSVPWRSHIQHPPVAGEIGIKAWALTCEPPLHLEDPALKRNYEDEADLFYADPRGWIRLNMARSIPQTALDNRGTRPRREAGLHQAHASSPGRNKKLWGKKSELFTEELDSDQGLDINDLLPYLITMPSSKIPSARNNAAATHENVISLDTTNPQPRVRTQTENQSFDIQSKSDLETARQHGTSPSSASHFKRPWPHYLAFFQQLEPLMTSILRNSGYRECWRTFNSHWHDDWRRKGDVIVWCLRPVE